MPRSKVPEIPRNEAYFGSTPRRGRMRETRSFGFTQGRESFDLAQDRELVEWYVERPFGFAQGHEPVERQMGVFQQPIKV
jgi:hypothetical protein